jgi:hypothetical protein
MATDAEIIDGVFSTMTAEELEVPTENLSVTQGSNLIALTPQIVNFVLNRLKLGNTPRQIRDWIKANHPQKKSISWQQMRLIIEKRREYYAAAYAAENPEPTE